MKYIILVLLMFTTACSTQVYDSSEFDKYLEELMNEPYTADQHEPTSTN